MLSEYTVIDTVKAPYLEIGDVIRYSGQPMEIKSILDEGEIIVVGLADEFGEIDEFPLPDYEMVDVLAIIDEDVYI